MQIANQSFGFEQDSIPLQNNLESQVQSRDFITDEQEAKNEESSEKRLNSEFELE